MELVEKRTEKGGFDVKKAFLRPKRGRGSKLSTGHSTDVEKLAVVNVGFHLLAAPKVVVALRGEERGEAPGLGDYRQRCAPSQRREKCSQEREKWRETLRRLAVIIGGGQPPPLSNL
jgi:hypothetical protein